MPYRRSITCGGFSAYSGPCGDCEACAPGRTEDERRELEDELSRMQGALAEKRELIETAAAQGCSAPAVVYIEADSLERESWELEDRLYGPPGSY